MFGREGSIPQSCASSRALEQIHIAQSLIVRHVRPGNDCWRLPGCWWLRHAAQRAGRPSLMPRTAQLQRSGEDAPRVPSHCSAPCAALAVQHGLSIAQLLYLHSKLGLVVHDNVLGVCRGVAMG